MPGAELTPEGRAELIRLLTITGWLLLGGPIGFVAFQFERMRGVTDQPFASVFDQRIEVLSFLMLPPNLAVFAPAVFVAACTTWLADAERGPWLDGLLRLSASVVIVLVVVGVMSIASILGNDDGGPTDFEGIFLRLGGIAMAAGMVMLCRVADRAAA